MALYFHSTEAHYVHTVCCLTECRSQVELECFQNANALNQPVRESKQAHLCVLACLHASTEQPTAHVGRTTSGAQSLALTHSKTCAQAVPADGGRPGDAAIHSGRLHGTSIFAAVGSRGGKCWTHWRGARRPGRGAGRLEDRRPGAAQLPASALVISSSWGGQALTPGRAYAGGLLVCLAVPDLVRLGARQRPHRAQGARGHEQRVVHAVGGRVRPGWQLRRGGGGAPAGRPVQLHLCVPEEHGGRGRRRRGRPGTRHDGALAGLGRRDRCEGVAS